MRDDESVPTAPFSLKGAKIAFIKTPTWGKAGPGTRAAYKQAMKIMLEEDAVVEQIELPKEFAEVETWHAAVLAGEGRTSFLGSEWIFSFFCFSPSF
jgi:Asp-tRNA(Asn)/Glu-tRNA(Gln) amidotransferase A subunit family amidase